MKDWTSNTRLLRRSGVLLLLIVALLVMGGTAARAGGTLFTNVNPGLPAILSDALAWGDYDNDGDLDVLVTGRELSGETRIARVYTNDGGSFSNRGVVLDGITDGSAEWGDYDNDNDLDILLIGFVTASTYDTEVYRNDGADGIGGWTFTNIDAGLTGDSRRGVWGDYDNDGDLDILATHASFRNDGGDTFTQDADVPTFGTVLTTGDYDNDADLDVAATNGLYQNDGTGNFTRLEPFYPSLQRASFEWGDYDNDGDLDFLVTGAYQQMLSLRISSIYRNDGQGTFTEIDDEWIGVIGHAQWGDFDNDGDLDVLLSGNESAEAPNCVFTLFRNDGSDSFSTVTDTGFEAYIQCNDIAWGDYDNDTDLDILFSGWNSTSRVVTVYRNNSGTANTPPGPPSGLTATPPEEGTAVLSWSAGSDTQTPAKGLTYNLRVGTTPGGYDVVSPMAFTTEETPAAVTLRGGSTEEHRLLPQMGNAQTGVSAILKGLEPNTTYYWSVQAVDTGFKGSAFAPENSFTVPPLAVQLSAFTAVAGDSQVLVTWETESEVGNQGFNLYRSETTAAPNSPLNDALIPSQAPDSTEGNAYEWLDRSVVTGDTYYYWLEAVDTQGFKNRYGPVSVTVTAPTSVTMSLLAARPSSLLEVGEWMFLGLAFGVGVLLSRRWRR